MIKKIKDVSEGDIIEFGEHSEPLYFYSFGKMSELTPREYNVIVNVPSEKRALKLMEFRMKF